MSAIKSHTIACGIVFWLGLLLAGGARVHAERLPIKTYTTVDGLPRNIINRIVRDSHGFLWFCTPEGLSRFDGYKFITYGTAQGLPHRSVNDFLETRSGVYWVATAAGLCRYNPKASSGSKFVLYRPSEKKAWPVTSLIEDRAGAVWCGTHGGLYRLAQFGSSPLP